MSARTPGQASVICKQRAALHPIKVGEEFIADCIRAGDAEFIVTAWNAHDDLVAALAQSKAREEALERECAGLREDKMCRMNEIRRLHAQTVNDLTTSYSGADAAGWKIGSAKITGIEIAFAAVLATLARQPAAAFAQRDGGAS